MTIQSLGTTFETHRETRGKRAESLKRIAVTGAGGFIGRALVAMLRARGYGVIALGRSTSELRFPEDVELRTFDPNAGDPDARAFDQAYAVVHLAGETVAGRWTAEKKRAIYDSRIRGTRKAVASCALAEEPPSVFICSSATGYYGSRGDKPLDERANPGEGFLAGVCADWEHEAARAECHAMRAVQLRTGIVLGDGGALAKMAAPFRLGIGGAFGSGRQFVPWIHLDDLVNLYVLAIENKEISGPVNAVAPDYATSARFSQALGVALRRPAIAPVPAFALRLALGQFSETLLGSQLVIPAVAMDGDFHWIHPNLERALGTIYKLADSDPNLRRYRAEQFIAQPLESVFQFFSNARNLEAITPPALRFQFESLPPQLKRGAQLSYGLSLHGKTFSWTSMISRWNPPYGFDDVQLHGPYALWQHEHRFQATDGGTLMSDDVTYALPLYPFGNLALPFVAADVERIFAFRKTAVERALRDAAAS